MTLHRHHRKRRSQGGTDDPVNIMWVSPDNHRWIHDNPKQSYFYGWLVKSFDDPEKIKVRGFALYEDGWYSAFCEDTKQCPKCQGIGRVPNEPKPEKPKEAKPKGVYSFRIPKDALENGHEVVTSLIDSARDHLAPLMGWSETVSPYYVIVAVFHDWHGSNT